MRDTPEETIILLFHHEVVRLLGKLSCNVHFTDDLLEYLKKSYCNIVCNFFTTENTSDRKLAIDHQLA